MKLNLERKIFLENATIGELTFSDPALEGVSLFTLERPWVGNKKNVSCIPVGKYAFTPHGWGEDAATKFKMVWRLEGVPLRSAILFHVGNTAGDTNGCILVGSGVMIKDGEASLLESRKAIDTMRRVLGERSGVVRISTKG